MKPRVTAQRLRELLEYAPETGLFYWRKQRGRAGAGSEAGTSHSHGYRVIQIDGRRHYAHRLAWLDVHGEQPSQEIDHINRNRTDNRIVNLRQCSRPENARNVLTRNPSGFKGVHRGRRKWEARIEVSGKQFYLGSYDTAAEAAAVYDAAARHYFKDFARTNAASSEMESHQIRYPSERTERMMMDGVKSIHTSTLAVSVRR